MPESVRQLAARVLTSGPGERPRLLRQLARSGDPQTAFVALAAGGPQLRLEFLARLTEPVPPTVVRSAIPLLSFDAVALSVRLAAAGKLLSGLSDPAVVSGLIQQLVAGLSDSDRLARLLELQRRVDRCEPLDQLIQNAESERRHLCPRCQTVFSRPDLIAHLWHEHRLVYSNGRPADPRPMVEAAIAASGDDPTGEMLDAAYLLSQHVYPDAAPALVFQALARGIADPTQTDRLLERATASHCGVCPVCLSAVPDPLPPLPPPADVGYGRVSADGFTAAVTDTATGRVIELTTPAGPREPPDSLRLPPPMAATLYALPVFGVGLLVTLVMPGRLVHPLAMAGLMSVAGWLTYVLIRSNRRELPDINDAAVTLTWRELVPGIGRSPAAVRFLTRLCRGSIGFGDPVPRAGRVHELAEQSAVLDRKGESYSQLAAAAAVLRASDAVRMGREPVATLVEVFRPFAQGRASVAFAEAGAEIILADLGLPADELQRLGLGVTAILFDAGLTPPDLLLIVRLCPWLKKLIPAANPDHLAGLYVIWQLTPGRGWTGVGSATTVFDLVANYPPTARRLLGAHPDALLRLDLGDAATDAVGAVVLTSVGVAVGGLLISDPSERFEAIKTPSGWQLRVGEGLLAADAPIPAKLTEQLREWLIWHAGRLQPKADASLDRRADPVAAERLLAVVADCPLCGTRCAWQSGRLGTPWQAVSGA